MNALMERRSNFNSLTTIDELLNSGYITIRTFNGCKNYGYETLGSLLKLNEEEVYKWRNCGNKVVNEIKSLKEKLGKSLVFYLDENSYNPSILNSETNSNLKKLLEISRFFSSISSFLNPSVQQNNLSGSSGYEVSMPTSTENNKINDIDYLKIYLNDIVTKINEPTFIDAIKNNEQLINNSFDIIKRIISDLITKIKTDERILNIFNNFKEVTSGIEIKKDFPFLREDEINFCLQYKKDFNSLPNLFILHKALIRSEERKAQILCYKNGLYNDGIEKSLDEIAKIFEISRERVRQLSCVDLKFMNTLVSKELLNYSIFNDFKFLNENDNYIKNLIKDQNLNLSNRQVIGLVSTFTPYHKVYSFKNSNTNYLVYKSLIERIRFTRIEEYIRDNIPSKRMYDIEIKLEDLIQLSSAYKLGNEWNDPFAKKIIIQYLYDEYNLELSEDETFVWEQTYISYEEILEIVAEKNGIVSREEIEEEFEIRFPGLKTSYMDIPENPYLASVGNKGYVPKSERFKYFTSIGDCVEAILKEKKILLDLPTLLDELLERGCETTLRSLRTLLTRNEEKRFQLFNGDLFGLRCIEYQDIDKEAIKIFRKKSFNTRIEELKDFTETNQRMPSVASKDSNEASLGRWIRNTNIGFIESTEEQREFLNNILSSYKLLPQNSHEVRFLKNCEQYKKVVAFLHHRPSMGSRPQLCTWFYASLNKQLNNQLSDNNKRHFQDLLDWLEEQGVFYG